MAGSPTYIGMRRAAWSVVDSDRVPGFESRCVLQSVALTALALAWALADYAGIIFGIILGFRQKIMLRHNIRIPMCKVGIIFTAPTCIFVKCLPWRRCVSLAMNSVGKHITIHALLAGCSRPSLLQLARY